MSDEEILKEIAKLQS